MNERFELAINRIKEIATEDILPLEQREFFAQEADFLLFAHECIKRAREHELCKLDISELKAVNKGLYEKQVNITSSEALYPYLSALDAELKAIIPYIFEQDLDSIVIRLELFLEFYSAYLCAIENGLKEPALESLKDILYYYVYDYTDEATDKKLKEFLGEEDTYIDKLLRNSDWSDVRSLYCYGEYVTSVEEKCLEHINTLPKDTLQKMADTFTEGYRIGFEVTNKDLSKKKLCEIRYHIGFEPVVKLAIENFEKMGLRVHVRRSVRSLLTGRGMNALGLEGAEADKQYIFDHKDDMALIMDGALNTVRLESLQRAYEKYKVGAGNFAGPAVMEVFGEEPFEYETKENVPHYSDEQQKLLLKYMSEAGQIQRRYIIEEERSFTIIAFPTPDIGPQFPEIFNEVVKLNTLDYMLYRNVQQTIIDTLDKGDYCLVKGMNGNSTNLKVNLWKLKDPDKETIFENCVADVNIPVGEVFTSPKLEETCGVLNVKKVFLNGMEYRDLSFEIEDGVVKDYTCSNFEDEDANKKYISDNILYHHDFLPMGEFAIGTNTTAYTMAKTYGIEAKMPILIAEKTGPHFAFGDTCYSNSEEVRVYNPDGKEIVAKENTYSLKRHEDPLKAYFNCHTDITIPYDELGELSVVTMDNEVIPIIIEGRFVLEGTEVLNEALK